VIGGYINITISPLEKGLMIETSAAAVSENELRKDPVLNKKLSGEQELNCVNSACAYMSIHELTLPNIQTQLHPELYM